MKKILIIGASGFVGGCVLAAAEGRINEIFASFRTRPLEFPGVRSFPLDITLGYAVRRVVTEMQPEAVIHCAALAGMDYCEENPDEAFRVNAGAVKNLAGACQEAQTRLIFLSTDMVFDGKRGNYSEKDTTGPLSVYGRSKCEAERCIEKNCENFVIARAALIYGRPFTGSNSASEKILADLRRGIPVRLFRDQYRTPIRVDELALSLLELAEGEFTGLIHLGGPERVDRLTFGRELAGISGFSEDLILSVSMKDVSLKAPRPRDSSLDISLAKDLLRTRISGYHEGLELSYKGKNFR